MKHPNYRNCLIALALLGFAVDQASKYVVFRWLRNEPHYREYERHGNFTIIRDAFAFHAQYVDEPASGWLQRLNGHDKPHVNKGALFGLGNDGIQVFGLRLKISPDQANVFFAVVSVLAASGILIWACRKNSASDRLFCLSLALILGGTLGNLYDRVVFGGVRDFLHWTYLVNWPVFNIADCCLVVGAFLLLAQAFFTHPTSSPAPNPVAASPENTASPNLVPSV